MKLGGEFLFFKFISQNCRECNGIIDAQGGPVPANLEELFPVWNDISTWNLAALSDYEIVPASASARCRTYIDRYTYAGWLQDNWTATSRLTLNLGVRYDLSTGIFGNDIPFEPFLEAGRPNDTNNIAPRVGFAYTLTDRTVVRGGYAGRVLHRTVSEHQLTHALVAAARGCRSAQRWPAGLRGQSLQRAGADAGAGTRAPLLDEQRARLPAPQRPQRHRRSERAVAVQLPGLGRCAAAAREHDGGRGRLRLHRRAARGTTRTTSTWVTTRSRAPTCLSRSWPIGRTPSSRGWGWSGWTAAPTSMRWRPRSPSASATGGRRRRPTRWASTRRPRRSRSADSRRWCRFR